MIGAVIALPRIRLGGARLGPAATLSGLAILAAAMWLITPEAPFLGIVALAPCLGAALLIWGAHRPSHFLARTLSTRPFRFFADISYSLYLVHWPIVVFGHMLFPDSNAVAFAVVGTALSVALAVLSFRYVEQPARLNRRLFPTRIVFAGAAGGLACVIALAGVVVLNAGFPARLTDRANVILATLQYNPKPAFQTEVCFMEPHQDVSDFDVGLCIPRERPLAVLWGDSHLSQYLHGLRPLFAEQGYSVGQFGSSGCAPALDVDSAIRPKCRAFNDFAIAQILALKPDLVILGAVWTGASEQLEGLGRSIATLQEAGIRVVVFGNAPFYKTPVPTILANRLLSGDPSTRSGAELKVDFVIRNNAAVQAYVTAIPGARFVSILDAACDATGCPLEHAGRPLHFDIAHVTDTGSNYFASMLFPQIEPLLQGDR